MVRFVLFVAWRYGVSRFRDLKIAGSIAAWANQSDAYKLMIVGRVMKT